MGTRCEKYKSHLIVKHLYFVAHRFLVHGEEPSRKGMQAPRRMIKRISPCAEFRKKFENTEKNICSSPERRQNLIYSTNQKTRVTGVKSGRCRVAKDGVASLDKSSTSCRAMTRSLERQSPIYTLEDRFLYWLWA